MVLLLVGIPMVCHNGDNDANGAQVNKLPIHQAGHRLNCLYFVDYYKTLATHNTTYIEVVLIVFSPVCNFKFIKENMYFVDYYISYAFLFTKCCFEIFSASFNSHKALKQFSCKHEKKVLLTITFHMLFCAQSVVLTSFLLVQFQHSFETIQL